MIWGNTSQCRLMIGSDQRGLVGNEDCGCKCEWKGIGGQMVEPGEGSVKEFGKRRVLMSSV